MTENTLADYRALFEALPNGYIAFLPDDPDFTIAAENRSHAQMALVEDKDILGKPLFEVFPDTSKKYQETGESDLLQSLRKVMRTRKPDTMPTLHYDLPGPDGQLVTKYWRVTHYPLLSAKKKVVLLFQATEDITQEVAAGNKLRLAQDQLEDALSVGMIGTYVWQVGSDQVVGDRNMAKMFGLTVEAAADGLPLGSFTGAIHSDDRPRVQREIAAALESSDTFSSEYRTMSAEGEIHWLIARGRIERDKSGSAELFAGVVVDITDRKLIENNLSYLAKASAVLSQSLDYKKTLQTIAKLMVPDIADWCTIDILGADGQLEQVAVAHRDPSKVRWAVELRRKQGPPDLSESGGIANVMRTGRPEFIPLITPELIDASKPDEETLEILRVLSLTSLIIVPLKIHSKPVGAISLITTDQKRQYTPSDLEMAIELSSRASLAMTNASLYDEAQKELAARTRLEEELRIANDELESRVEARTQQLEETNVSLQRSNQELQDFAYVASHDLQEPLRKIQAFGNLLETEFSAELGEGKDYLSRMRSAAARMSNLIEDILAFSRVTTKGREFTPVNLHKITTEVIGDLEIRIADTKAIIDVGDLPTIHADAMQMRQLLQNLIANALKFHREGVTPHISVTASTVDDEPIAQESPTETSKHSKIKYCRLEVRDNGLGFDEKYLDRIFAVFQRLHNRDTYEGTGIGLAVCRKIVERHGGTITARSTTGEGSTFIITLPMRHKKGESLL